MRTGEALSHAPKPESLQLSHRSNYARPFLIVNEATTQTRKLTILYIQPKNTAMEGTEENSEFC